MLGVSSAINFVGHTVNMDVFIPHLQEFGLLPQNLEKNEYKDYNIGIYTKDHMAAEGLAFVFGGVLSPEISSSLDSAYYHYHDASHSIHIWYGIQY